MSLVRSPSATTNGTSYHPDSGSNQKEQTIMDMNGSLSVDPNEGDEPPLIHPVPSPAPGSNDYVYPNPLPLLDIAEQMFLRQLYEALNMADRQDRHNWFHMLDENIHDESIMTNTDSANIRGSIVNNSTDLFQHCNFTGITCEYDFFYRDPGHVNATAGGGGVDSEVGDDYQLVGATLRQRVTVVDLSHMGLSGTLPNNFLPLSRLRRLILPNNTISGHVPTHLPATLWHLNLSDNRLDGLWFRFLLPQEATEEEGNGNDQDLQDGRFNATGGLLMSSNAGSNGNGNGSLVTKNSDQDYVTGAGDDDGIVIEPLSAALLPSSQLKRVILSGNQLTGTIPANLCTMAPGLRALHLSHNEGINGTLPECLGVDLPDLQALRIRNTRLTGPVPKNLCPANLDTSLLPITSGGNSTQTVDASTSSAGSDGQPPVGNVLQPSPGLCFRFGICLEGYRHITETEEDSYNATTSIGACELCNQPSNVIASTICRWVGNYDPPGTIPPWTTLPPSIAPTVAAAGTFQPTEWPSLSESSSPSQSPSPSISTVPTLDALDTSSPPTEAPIIHPSSRPTGTFLPFGDASAVPTTGATVAPVTVLPSQAPSVEAPAGPTTTETSSMFPTSVPFILPTDVPAIVPEDVTTVVPTETQSPNIGSMEPTPSVPSVRDDADTGGVHGVVGGGRPPRPSTQGSNDGREINIAWLFPFVLLGCLLVFAICTVVYFRQRPRHRRQRRFIFVRRNHSRRRRRRHREGRSTLLPFGGSTSSNSSGDGRSVDSSAMTVPTDRRQHERQEIEKLTETTGTSTCIVRPDTLSADPKVRFLLSSGSGRACESTNDTNIQEHDGTDNPEGIDVTLSNDGSSTSTPPPPPPPPPSTTTSIPDTDNNSSSIFRQTNGVTNNDDEGTKSSQEIFYHVQDQDGPATLPPPSILLASKSSGSFPSFTDSSMSSTTPMFNTVDELPSSSSEEEVPSLKKRPRIKVVGPAGFEAGTAAAGPGGEMQNNNGTTLPDQNFEIAISSASTTSSDSNPCRDLQELAMYHGTKIAPTATTAKTTTVPTVDASSTTTPHRPIRERRDLPSLRTVNGDDDDDSSLEDVELGADSSNDGRERPPLSPEVTTVTSSSCDEYSSPGAPPSSSSSNVGCGYGCGGGGSGGRSKLVDWPLLGIRPHMVRNNEADEAVEVVEVQKRPTSIRSDRQWVEVTEIDL